MNRFERQIVFRSGLSTQRCEGYGGAEAGKGDARVEQMLSDRPVVSGGLVWRVGCASVDGHRHLEVGMAWHDLAVSTRAPSFGAVCGIELGFFESVGIGINWHDFAAMHEAVDDGDYRGGAGEDFVPLGKRLVGGDQDGAFFVASRDNLEKEIGVA